MVFEERKIGEYHIYAGALEAPTGDGYIAALVVQRQKPNGAAREILRDDSIACGHRWPSPAAALAYAITKGQDAIRRQAFAQAA